VHFLWQAAVVAMLLAAFLRLLQKSRASLRYLVSCSALALIVALPVVTVRLIKVAGPAAEAGPLTTTPSAAAPSTTVQVVKEMLPLSPILDSPATLYPAAEIPWSERMASVLRPVLPCAVLGWLAGVFGLSAWHLGGWMQLQRLQRRMVRSIGTALQDQAADLSRRLGVRRAVTLLESALVEVPTVVGWLRPVILLPASALTGLSPEQLEAILAHELAHIRRYDYLVNVLQTIVEILGFYHPAVWWVSRRIRIERENCCDDAAVRICGDSVRYARALTCLEEVRHSQAELAMAATGGSLLDRIARLLGRPAVDDRRFAWLPGLITLLLVAGVLIPTALALTSPELPQSRLSPAEESTPTYDIERPPEPRKIRLDFAIARIAPDEKLDRDTAIRARAFLVSAATEGDSGVPSVEELQQPLSQVIEKYVARLNLVGESAEAFTDLLISRGHVKILASPSILTHEGQRARIATGEDPNRARSDASDGTRAGGFSLEVTPTIQDDPNAILLSIGLDIDDFVMLDPVDGQARVRAETVKLETFDALRNGQCKMYPLHVAADPESVGTDVKVDTLVFQITASVVDEHPTAEPNMPGADAWTQSAEEPNAAEADKAQVQVDVKIVRAVGSSELDRDTILRIEKILGKRVRPEGPAGEFGPRLHLTAHDIRRDHVVQQALPAETLDALLPLFRDLKVLSSPRVLARDGMTCQIKIVNDEYVRTIPPADGSSEPGKLERIEAGTKVDLTAHVRDHNEVTLDIMVEMVNVVRPLTDANMPVIEQRMAQATVTMLSGQYVTIGGMTDNSTPVQGDDGLSLYIMASPTIVSAHDANEPALGMGGMGGFREPPGEVDARVFVDSAANRQWLQLRTQHVNSDPLYRELARRIVQIEHELITDGQTFTPQHPQMVQKRALLDALKERMNERKKTLEQEFENQTTETRRVRLKNLTAEHLQSHLSMLFPQYVSAEPADRADPNNLDLIVTAPATIADQVITEIARIDVRPRHMLLDIRIVEMERRDLRDLGAEWTQDSADPNVQGSPSESGAYVGRFPDRASSNLLRVRLNLLMENNRVDILSSPQVIGREGHQIRIQPISEEYVHTFDPRIHIMERRMGIIFSIVPYVHDRNDISLNVGCCFNDQALRNRDPNSPVARPDAPTNTITVHDGGTAVLAMPEKNTGNADDSQRMVALFITPSLIDDPAELTGAMDTGAK